MKSLKSSATVLSIAVLTFVFISCEKPQKTTIVFSDGNQLDKIVTSKETKYVSNGLGDGYIVEKNDDVIIMKKMGSEKRAVYNVITKQCLISYDQNIYNITLSKTFDYIVVYYDYKNTDRSFIITPYGKYVTLVLDGEEYTGPVKGHIVVNEQTKKIIVDQYSKGYSIAFDQVKDRERIVFPPSYEIRGI